MDSNNEATFAEFASEFNRFKDLSSKARQRFKLSWEDRYPCLLDHTTYLGYDRHYVYHLAWAARVLARTKPKYHTDVSSNIYFPAILSAFMEVRYYEFRLPDLDLSNLTCGTADLTALPFADESISSISCMHTVEHIGLGRYGDPLDPEGDIKAMAELRRVLAPDGSLLLVVPVGRPRIQFNAHRIYSYELVTDEFDGLELIQFTLIPDDPGLGGLVHKAPPDLADDQLYACGCFWFKRRKTK